jgi:FkbM family methyltransferase
MHDLIPNDMVSESIAKSGFYDWDHSKFMIRCAQKTRQGLFVDVGANLGYFSLLWAGLTYGKVVAYEASPRNIELFQKSIERNRLQDRITLVPKALGSHSGSVAFDVGPKEQTGWGGISKNPSDNTVTVPMVRLDEELPNTWIDFLKIDVEGADTWVLFGCEGLLKKQMIKTICFEQNRGRMDALDIAHGEAQLFLKRFGYECHPMGGDDMEWIAFPIKGSRYSE